MGLTSWTQIKYKAQLLKLKSPLIVTQQSETFMKILKIKIQQEQESLKRENKCIKY